MAKEMMIVFVYDSSKCCNEEDDPAEAVMYFHPAWVSPTQKLALAGQLMGVYHFLSMSFSMPRFIALQGGKFVVKKLNQYILVIGTDRNIHDWILERRADTLESILQFFHCDLRKISESFNNDKNKFTEKLYQMFETYLPILQYSANLFSNIPTMKLPKSASNVFLEAVQVLQYFQETNGVLGGALFYSNKVIATQLSPELTKLIVITDPYRIKAPADRVPVEFSLPLGVQLLTVYVEKKQLNKLIQESNNERCYSSYLESVVKKSIMKKMKNSGMKRDVSRIFTVPEESELDSSNYVITKPRTVALSRGANPLTPSVCSTPLTEVNKILHGTAALLICNTTDEEDQESKKKETDDIPDVVKEALRCKRLNKLKNSVNNKINLLNKRSSSSTSDLTKIHKLRIKRRLSRTITDPCYPIFRSDGLPISKNYCRKTNSNEQFKNVEIKFDRLSLKEKKHSIDVKMDNKSQQEVYKRSMSLPLKPLNVTDSNESDDFLHKRKLDGLQLTPLMSKLSLLADERIKGFSCSRDTTPSEFRKFPNQENDDTKEETDTSSIKDTMNLEKTQLLLCGHQNMVLILLMDNGTADSALVDSIWGTCTKRLGNLETRLQQCLDPLPSNESKELYSVLSTDPEWDTNHRSGLWGVTELDIVSCLHGRFKKCNNLTDIVVRTEDTVIYGNQCGASETFYQQSIASSNTGGLPTPADLMGIVSLKAKRRLERDHGILLL